MRARGAVTTIFALNGFLFASLFSRLPAIRDSLDLSEGQIGLALFCGMLGLIASQPAAGALVSRRGSRPVVMFGAIGYSLGLVPVAEADSLTRFCIGFALIGFMSGTLDTAMNVQGVTVERLMERPLLGSMHAAFSFGALAGAGIGSVLAALDVAYTTHLYVAAGVGAFVAINMNPLMLPPEADMAPEGPRFARPTRALAGLGALAFCVLLSEGSVGDWIAVLLSGELDTSQGVAALGLTAFSLAMGIGRLWSDRLVERFGPVRLVRYGALLAAAGLGCGLAVGEPPVAIFGVTLMGFGLAAIFPIAIRAAASGPQGAGPAVAAVTGMGYIGFVAGPPMIGALAEAASLRAGLVLVVVLCAVAALLAREVGTRHTM